MGRAIDLIAPVEYCFDGFATDATVIGLLPASEAIAGTAALICDI
jgi:hypothetical protein